MQFSCHLTATLLLFKRFEGNCLVILRATLAIFRQRLTIWCFYQEKPRGKDGISKGFTDRKLFLFPQTFYVRNLIILGIGQGGQR